MTLPLPTPLWGIQVKDCPGIVEFYMLGATVRLLGNLRRDYPQAELTLMHRNGDNWDEVDL